MSEFHICFIKWLSRIDCFMFYLSKIMFTLHLHLFFYQCVQNDLERSNTASNLSFIFLFFLTLKKEPFIIVRCKYITVITVIKKVSSRCHPNHNPFLFLKMKWWKNAVAVRWWEMFDLRTIYLQRMIQLNCDHASPWLLKNLRHA